MPEWTGNKRNSTSFDISPPSSPDSTTSSQASQANRAPPPPPAEGPETAAAAAAAAGAGAKVLPPKPPPSAALPPPREAQAASATRPQGPVRRPSLMLQVPSFEALSRAAGATPPTGPEPSPTGSVAANEPQEHPMPPQREPRLSSPRTAVKNWPAASPAAAAGGSVGVGATVGAQAAAGRGSPRVALPTSATKISRASPMRPKGKGTPARRGKHKKSPISVLSPSPSASSKPGEAAAAAVAAAVAAAPAASPAASPAAPAPKPSPAALQPSPAVSQVGSSLPVPPIPSTGALARRILDVEIVEAAGLLGTEKGGVSNPRADILLVDLGGRVIKSEGVKRTGIVKRSTNPVWNHKVTFGNRTNLSSPPGGNMPTLRIQVYSEQRFAAEKPLGMVDIPLVNLSVDGEEWEQSYSLEPFGRLRAGGRLGSIHLRLKIGAVVDKRDASSRVFADLQRGLNDRGDEEPGYMDQPPNFLKITLHRGQELLAMDIGNTSDPFVIFRIGGKEKRSSVIQKTLNPEWEEVFEFECTTSGESLEITVMDEDRFVNDFMGFTSILMGDLEDKRKMRQWFDLKLKSGELPPGEERGAIEITSQWFFNPAVAAKGKTKKRADFGLASFLHLDTDSDTEEDEEGYDTKEDPNAQISAKEADPEEKKKRQDEKDRLLAELRDFKVVTGDYVAYVHIIEVRELKGEDLQGTSDPVVYVEAFGQKFATEVVKNRLNAVFDETFVIPLRNMDQDDFKEGVFRISVMDADVTIGSLGSLKADLIGAVSFDATYVYFNHDHEVHRRWVALVDDENPDDVGIQGYLHLSIAIVGPNDRLKVHDEEADRRRERATEADAGGMDSLVVMPPAIEIQQKWLVSTVAKAEYLPVMDKNFAGGAGGGDFFFQVEVAGGKPIRTKKVSLTGDRHRLNPEWRYELWQPVTTPCMSGNVKFSVWDWDPVGDNDLVGVFYGKLRDIEGRMNDSDSRPSTGWVNLYGPPLNIPETRNLKVLTKRAATLGLVSQTDYLNQYLNFPDRASTYRGRVLVMQRIVERAPKAHEKDKAAWRRKIKSPPVPKAAQYAMRLFVGSGTEIPQFTDVTHFGKNKKMWLRISVGRYELSTEPVDNNKGVCEWYQSLQLKTNFNLPADPAQVPDLIIHLMAGTGTGAQPCSFVRFSAKDIIDEKFGGGPKWIRLQEDKVLDLLVDNEFPGSVLVRMGLGPIETYLVNKSKWKDEIQGLLKKEPYELRVHLYQARNLPATDSTGLIDPYLKVKFRGQVHNTENNKDLRRRKTVDPIWYHTLRFNATLPPIEYQRYFPQVTVQLFDYDIGFVDDYAGNLFLELQDLKIFQADRRTESVPPPPTPHWESFFMETPGDAQGELLVSVQLIHTKSAELPEPESIIPAKRNAHLDMVIVGIRNMQPFKYLPMQLPYCVFEVDDMDGTKRSVLTESSNKPTGPDANFLQRIKMELQLPLDVIYAPRVKIRVYDTRLGGFNVPLVGSGRIELGKKLPWSPEYEAPLVKTFAKDALLRAINPNDDSEDGREEASTNGGNGSVRSGRSYSGRTRGGGDGLKVGGVDWGSEDDSDSDGGFSRGSGGGGSTFRGAGAAPSAHSGFGFDGGFRMGATPSFGGRSSVGGVVRTKQRVFGGGGAMEVLASSRSDIGVDHTPHLNASGKVVDTGIGIMPALDLARQKAALTAAIPGGGGSQASTPAGGHRTAGGGGGGASVGAAGVLGDTGGSSLVDGVMSGATENLARDWEEEDDEISQVPPYMRGRDTLEQSLEEELLVTPFESYDLYRGQVLGAFGGGSTLKKVGKLKCIVRVTEGDPDEEPLFVDKANFPTLAKAKARNDTILTELLKPKGYKVRLYVLQALNLTAMDMGLGGRPGKSDPYLRVRLGKATFNDQKNYIEDVTDADFYKCIELNSFLPGTSQLQIDVVDYDDLGRDELIGRTTIDLEDRWFDTRWQAWGLHNRSEDMGDMRFQTKPVETRTLLVPTSLAPQGHLRCWLDIMSNEDSRAFNPDDVSLPPNHDFEVRVVFWKCKDVVSMDTALDQNDLFVRSWMEGCDAQETDTHWFAKKGKGSFNWRMKFKVSLGPRTRAWKFPYLTVQLWDRDLFKFNDHIAEGLLDLGPYFIRAYKSRETVKLFPTIDPKMEQMRKADLGNMEVDAALGGNDATERLVGDLEDAPAAYDPERAPPPAYGAQDFVDSTGAPSSPAGGVTATNQRSPISRRASGTAPAAGAGARRKKNKQEEKKKKKKGCCHWFCLCCCRGCRKRAAPVEPGDSSDEEEDEEAAADARAFVNQIKNLTGLWDDDPDETYWLNMERTNFETGQKEQMGKCLMGVQIWPIEKADAQPVGSGRNDPNSQPFLPPPAGRLRFSLNPFVMGSELLGPKICAKVACVCCCVGSIAILVYFSGFFNLLFSFAIAIFQNQN